MNDIKAGMIFTTQFCSADSDAFTGYIDYIDRDEATRKDNLSKYTLFKGYLNYMGNEEKTTGLFTADQDGIDAKQKTELKKAYETAQGNGSLMWESIISFDNRYLVGLGAYDYKSGRLDDKRIKTAVRKSMSVMLEKENLSNAIWSASIHYNTDNIHVHVATVEPVPMRERKEYMRYEKEKRAGKWQYKMKLNKETGRKEKIAVTDDKGRPVKDMEYVGKFKESTIRAGKSAFIMELEENKELNKAITQLMRDKIVKGLDGDIFKEQDFREKITSLYGNLPERGDRNLWKYNANIMKGLRDDIDEISDMYIKRFHSENFAELQERLKERERQYEMVYGGSNNYAENKMQELYSRLGNAILKELRDYDRSMGRKEEAGGYGKRVKEGGNIIIKRGVGTEDREDLRMDFNGEYVESEARLNMYDDLPTGIPSKIEWSGRYKYAKRLIFKERRYEEAIAIFEDEDENGNALATYDLGDIYHYGRGRDIDLEKAEHFYKKALVAFEEKLTDVRPGTKRGEFLISYLNYRIGKMYNYGLGIEQDYEQAFLHFKESDNNPYAMYALGNLYFEGKGTEKDIAEAMRLYEDASARNPYAAYKLGEIYAKGFEDEDAGIFIPKNDMMADGYYERALRRFEHMAKDGGDDNLKYRVGAMYLLGKGTDIDIQKAESFLSDAAELGNPYAQYMLATKIILASEEPEEEDIKRALELLHASAEKGDNPIAQYALGKIYADKDSPFYDEGEAIRWLTKAAEKDNEYAQYALGVIYTNKRRKYFDAEKGMEYLRKASENGNSFADLKMGSLYMKGRAVGKDMQAARFWFEQAYKKGNPFAERSLESLNRHEERQKMLMKGQIHKSMTLAEKNFDAAMRQLRRSMNNQYETWRNEQEYEELQWYIAKSHKEELEM